MKLEETRVHFGATDYFVRLYSDFSGLKEELERIPGSFNYIIITEKKVADIYLQSVLDSISNSNVKVYPIIILGGEKNKHIDKLKNIFNKMIELGIDRNSVLIALGGGVIGDLAGFVAATYLRGIRFVQVPTTLLACVDSSVGGKVAVNADLGKNMIGAFHQPSLVYAPLKSLSTLPAKEWRCGLAEVIKHSLLSDSEFFDTIYKMKASNFKFEENLRYFIRESVKYKTSIVSEDEKETGKRAVLNLGHTLAHAIESATQYRKYSHGEAVAIGLIAAIMLSCEERNLSREVLDKLISILRKFKFPLKDNTPPEILLQHMRHDKKNKNGIIKYVLLEQIGNPVWGCELSESKILEILKRQQELF